MRLTRSAVQLQRQYNWYPEKSKGTRAKLFSKLSWNSHLSVHKKFHCIISISIYHCNVTVQQIVSLHCSNRQQSFKQCPLGSLSCQSSTSVACSIHNCTLTSLSGTLCYDRNVLYYTHCNVGKDLLPWRIPSNPWQLICLQRLRNPPSCTSIS